MKKTGYFSTSKKFVVCGKEYPYLGEFNFDNFQMIGVAKDPRASNQFILFDGDEYYIVELEKNKN